MSVRPAEFPPPWSSSEAIASPTDPVDERIDVGFLIVGAGPAGLAAAIRLGQLVEEQPELAERLGEVPVAVLEKGKAPGSHLLSGAVINPRGLQRLFKGRKRIDELPFYGEVHGESVLFLTKKRCAAHSHAADDGQSPQLHRVPVAARAAGSATRPRRSA